MQYLFYLCLFLHQPMTFKDYCCPGLVYGQSRTNIILKKPAMCTQRTAQTKQSTSKKDTQMPKTIIKKNVLPKRQSSQIYVSQHPIHSMLRSPKPLKMILGEMTVHFEHF